MKGIGSLPPTYSALIAVISYALAYALIYRYSREYRWHPYTVIMFYSGVSTAYAILMRQTLHVSDMSSLSSISGIVSIGLPILILIGVFITAGDYFNVRALQAGDIVTTTSILATLPVFTEVFGYILDKAKGEKPSLQAVVGYIIIFIGIMITVTAPKTSTNH